MVFLFQAFISAKCPVPASLYPISKASLMLDGSRQMTPHPWECGWVWAVCHKSACPGEAAQVSSTNNQTVLAEAGIYSCKNLSVFCQPWFPTEAKVKFYAPCQARARHGTSEMCNGEPHTTQDMLKKCVPDHPDIISFGFKAVLLNLGCWMSLQSYRAALRDL